MNLRETIDNSPMSGYQWAIVIMAAIMNLLDGFDVLALAFTATAIRNEFGLTGVELGYLFSAGLFGMTAGSLFLAPFADKVGRRPLLLLAVALSAIGMFGSAFVSDYKILAFWRVITGLGVGGILVGTNVITSEYSSKKWRSFAISVYAAGFGIGAMLGGMFAVVLQAEYGWRSVYLVGAILTGLCFIALLFWLPESIDFLTSKQPQNAKIKLNKIAAKMGFVGDWALPPKVEQTVRRLPISQLFSPQYLRSTLSIWLAFIAIMFSYYFVSSWTPALLKEAGMTTEQSVTVGMMISLGGTAGALLYGLLAGRWSARSVLILFTLGSALMSVIFILSSATLWLAMLFGILVGALMNGCISGLYTLNPAIYAADIRSTGVGWSIGVGRIGAILAPTVAGMLLDNGWEKQSLYIGVAFVMLISTVALCFLKAQSSKVRSV
ncbi:MFS transporter [Conservatibacter flavescens]|uniref:MFS transporter n=1 Tax=Conservatibacter flavescens TaxID=28161 RepID=A0A2M8S1G7_9PAST|nr:MFS transporter [Conservatibacter flavescens]PJG84946.1 MFS transporter [Conservatibacter flavescens]